MAYITALSSRTPGQTRRIHSESEATWCLSDRNGEQVLQIDTYGSPERKDVGTISQSIQVDAAMAGELIAIIREAFPGIR